MSNERQNQLFAGIDKYTMRRGKLICSIYSDKTTGEVTIEGPFGTMRGGYKTPQEAIQYACARGYVYEDFAVIR